jgi:Uma2 family endonuclease
LISTRRKKGLFSYPDLVVICGEPQYLDRFRDVVINPSVIIEVLSQSTEQFDRTTKFMRYNNWNPTLTDYVLVAQSRPLIELYSRQADGSWNYRYAVGLESRLTIKSIHCTLSLAEVYDRVPFPFEEETDPAAETPDSPDAFLDRLPSHP